MINLTALYPVRRRKIFVIHRNLKILVILPIVPQIEAVKIQTRFKVQLHLIKIVTVTKIAPFHGYIIRNLVRLQNKPHKRTVFSFYLYPYAYIRMFGDSAAGRSHCLQYHKLFLLIPVLFRENTANSPLPGM